MSITLESAFVAAGELAQAGGQEVSVKYALWIAALSAQQELGVNGDMARILAKYVRGTLPDSETLVGELMQARGNLNGNHLRALYHAERLERAGCLDGLEDIGRDRETQVLWRDHVHWLFHDDDGGHGMSYKTISMAALLIDPLGCQLVPVDRHVIARFGLKTRTGKDLGSPGYKSGYERIEHLVIAERAAHCADIIPLGIWHWYKWEEWRQRNGDSMAVDGAESHAALSCRWYD